MRIRSIALLILSGLIALGMQGCPPTQTHEETVTISPSHLNTLNETAAGGDLCRGGTAPDNPEPGQIIVGFFHRFDNEDCWVNQIYEGTVRFPIDASPFNRRLIKSATLKLHAAHGETNPSRSSCIDKIGITDIDWWSLPRTERIHINDLRNIRRVPPAQDLSIDVTQEVQRWANNTEVNNGFILIGQRPEMSDFSNTGMLTNETCEMFYDNIMLTVTFFQFNNPPHHPTISVNSVHTQTTTDITVTGNDFTPNGSVHLYADDIPGRMGSLPLGGTTAGANGKFSFFYRALCTSQPDSATIRALDDVSGDNARDRATVFCH